MSFLNQFRLHARKSKNFIELSRIKQAPGETLKSYLDRFNQSVAEVSDPHEKTILIALIDEVDIETEFGIYLAGKPPLTRELFYKKVRIHLRQEETYANRKRKSAKVPREDIQRTSRSNNQEISQERWK